MIARWTWFCVRRRRAIALAWVVLILAALPYARTVNRHLTSSGFDDPSSAATWATNQAARVHPPKAPSPLLIVGMDGPGLKALVEAEGMKSNIVHRVAARQWLFLPSPATSVGQDTRLQEAVKRRGAAATPVSQQAIGNRIKRESSATLTKSGILAMPFLAVLLLLVFGSAMAISLPLIIALAGSEIALAIISLVAAHIQLSVFLTDIVSFLALGVGIDYALFISTRFRLNLDEGMDRNHAVVDAMRHAGRSVLYSGIAVALAVATLFLGSNAYWRGLALGGSVAIFSVLLATHSLLPAVMDFGGKKLFWGRIRGMNWRFWPRLAGAISRRPAWALLIGLAVLIPFSLLAPRFAMRTPVNLASMLPLSSPLRLAVAKEQQIQGPGSIAPLTVAIRLPTPLSDPQSWQAVARVSSRLSRLPGVARVLSPTGLGISPSELAAFSARPQRIPPTLKSFVTQNDRHLVVLYVTAKTGPDNPKTARLAGSIDHQLTAWLPAGSRAAAGGLVPILKSFNDLTVRRLPWIVAAALAVALVVLTWATGSLMQAVIGVVLDGLVALATAGFLVWVVHHGSWMGFEAKPLDSSITPLIFVLLFGLSMDYEVILLHRIQEPLRQHPENMRRSVERGLGSTGAMITGAGMIMVVVFLSLLISPLQVMKTLAVGLSFAVLADTWIVRTLLIPSVSVLLNQWAFWPWKPHAVPSERNRKAP